MKGPVGMGVVFGLVFIIVKMSAYLFGFMQENIVPSTLINILFLLLAIALGLYQYCINRTEPKESLMAELKQALKAGMIYTFIVSAFLYVFYNNIDKSLLSELKKERIEVFEKDIENPANFSEIKRSNEAFELMNKDEITEEYIKNVDTIISPRSVLLVSLMGMMLLSIFYSLLISIIYRKVLFRK
jgi:glucan phosphoethanolaminetransferase (alkaline phosphatase superfamily)